MLLLRLHDFEQTDNLTIRGAIIYVCHRCGMKVEDCGCPTKEKLNKYIAKYFEPCTGELTEVENN